MATHSASDYRLVFFCFNSPVFTLVVVALDRWHYSCVSWRKPFRLSRIRPESAPDPNSPATRLFACTGRKQRSCEGAQAIWIEGFPRCKVHQALEPNLPGECRFSTAQAGGGSFPV